LGEDVRGQSGRAPTEALMKWPSPQFDFGHLILLIGLVIMLGLTAWQFIAADHYKSLFEKSMQRPVTTYRVH
jgi:hypothetical protein